MQRTGTLVFTLAMLVATASADFGDQILKLLPDDGAADDAFGMSVDLDAGVIIAGAPMDDDDGSASGSAYVFDAATGDQIMKLVANDAQAGDQFGWSVAIDGGVIVVGARGEDQNGDHAGAAYLFDANTGVQFAKLTSDDGAAGDEFGHAVDINNGIVVVGAKRHDANGSDAGAAYVFDAANGVQLHKLLPDDGTTNDNFGGAAAIDDGVIVVGAHAKWNESLPLAGAAYLFDAESGEQMHKLLADDAAFSDFFGAAVDIQDGLVIVGAWAKSIVFDHSGAAYLFNAGSGAQLGPRLAPDDTADRDNFGFAVAIDNGLVAASAPGDSDGGVFEAGSAYLYTAPGAEELMEVRADDRAALDNLGASIAMADGRLVVGTDRDDDNGSNSGAAYVFRVDDGGCAPDFDGSGVVDAADLAALLAGWGGPDGDLTGDGTTDAADVAQLLAAWGPCA